MRRSAERFLVFLALILAACSEAKPPATTDLTAQRNAMVEQQIEARGVSDLATLEAMRTVPRHEFLPLRLREEAYADYPLPIGHGQTISQPFIVAFMTEAIRPQPGEKILEIGAGSAIEIVEPLAKHLGADDAIASRALLDERGHYTGEVEFYAYGPEKADAIVAYASRHGIDLAASHAYSDSATDEPMLRTVGHPVAVNPDRALARLAADVHWPVLVFDHPIALRDRVPLPTPGIALTAAAIGVGVATGVAVGWWLTHRDRDGGPTGFRRPGAS